MHYPDLTTMSLLGRHIVMLFLLVAACGRGVHLMNETKPIVYLLQPTVTDESGGTVLSSTVSAVEIAVRDVNESDAYSLERLTIPSQCDGGSNYTTIFDTLMDDIMGPVILLEGTCLEDSELIAEASRFFDFTLVSYSPACLVEPTAYFPNHFCVVPTSVSSHYGIAGVFVHFGWKRAEIITEVDYSLAYDTEMLVAVLNRNIEGILIREVCIGCEAEVDDLIVPDYHILILNTSPEQARDIICEAEVGYPNYLWIIPDWYPHQWWTECGAMSKCTQEELKTFLNRSIVISYQPEDGTTTVSGRAPAQFRSQFDEAFFASYAYDSVWTVHLGLENAVPQILETCDNSSENFINCSTDVIRENFEILNFMGISGPVSFDNGTRTLGQVSVLQFRRGSNAYGDLSQENIAGISIDRSNETLEFDYEDNENVSTVWPNGIPPDRTALLVQKPIYVLVIQPTVTDDTGGAILPPTISAVKLAVEDVNENIESDTPPLYSLEQRTILSQCDGGTNYTVIFDTLMDDIPGPVIILEGTCLEDSELIAEASRFFNFTLVSYSPACMAKPMAYFPNHFCVVPTNVSFYYGIAGVFAQFGWKTAQVITEEDYSLAYDTEMLVAVLKSNIEGIMIREVCIGCEDEMAAPLIVPNFHIVILNTSPEQARDIICETKVGYPNYLWIIPDWYPHQWWTECGATSKCTQEELKTFLNRSIVISYQPEDGTTTVSGRAPDQFRSQFDEAFFAPYAYDSIWTVHLGLENAVPQILEICDNSSENFINCATNVIRENIEMLNFLGVSGSVSLDSGARTLDQVMIPVLQFRRESTAYGILNEEKIACISNESLQFDYKDNENVSTVFPNGIPPDGTLIFIQKFIHSSTIVVFYLFAAAGIVFAIVCFAFMCIYQKRKLIRITSPGLNYVIIVGTILLYLSVIPTAHPRGLFEATEKVFCPLSAYILLLGYNMVLVTIDVRMWRVCYSYFRPHSKACKDWHLMLVVGILMVVDIITLTVTNAVPLKRYFAPMFPDPEHPSTVNERGVPVLFVVIQCIPQVDTYWLLVLYIYKAIFQTVGVVLALLTIKMKVEYYHEANEVRRILYTTTIFFYLLLVDLYFWLGHINIHAALTSFGLCIISTLVLGFIFIPKMIGLYRDPHGEQIPTPSATGTVTAIKETNDTVMATNVLALKAEEMELEAVVN